MTPKEFKKLMERDGACVHCGLDDETLVPQHRMNRQMGGAKKTSARNLPSNLLVFCSRFNQEIEQSASAATLARERGWKLASYEDPLLVPVWYEVERAWFLLDDRFGRVFKK
jgi:hypothetical protein